jgi:hypothetical protein
MRRVNVYGYGYRKNVLNAVEHVESKIKGPDLMYFSSFDLEIISAHIFIEDGVSLAFIPLLESL